MPIQECTLPEGGKGWKWGASGKCFANRADAEKQAAAAHANGYTGDSAFKMTEMRQDRIALDKLPSARTIDSDGHMRVAGSAVSRANVCGYHGSEIPDAESLGLDRNRVYQLYRDAASLQASAPSLNGKPLLVIHKPQTADEYDHKVVVGSLDNAVWDPPYLRADLTIWSQDAIDLVTSGEQKQLSCAYRYVPVMQPGIAPDGTPYDGMMTQIEMNHCALVAVGRAGPDVMVGDSANPAIPIPEIIPASTPETGPSSLYSRDINMPTQKPVRVSRAALLASGALQAYLPAKMATDAKIDLDNILKGVTAKNWKSQKPKIKTALDAALEGKLAEGADLADVSDLLDRIAADAEPDDDDEDEKKRKAKEAAEKLKEAAADEDDDDDKKKKGAEDEDDDDDESAMDEDDDEDDDKDDKKKPAFLKDKKGAKDKKGGASDSAPKAPKVPMVSKAAMDSAIASAVAKVRRDTEASTIARLRAIQDAEKAVRPYIGELAIAQDSAEDVYRLCLDHAGVDLEGVPPAAYPAMVKMLPKAGDVAPVKAARLAADSASMSEMIKRFPGVTALKQR